MLLVYYNCSCLTSFESDPIDPYTYSDAETPSAQCDAALTAITRQQHSNYDIGTLNIPEIWLKLLPFAGVTKL